MATLSFNTSISISELPKVVELLRSGKISEEDDRSLNFLLNKIVDKLSSRGRYAAGVLRKLNVSTNDFLKRLLMMAIGKRRGKTAEEEIVMEAQDLTGYPFFFKTTEDAKETIIKGFEELNNELGEVFDLQANFSTDNKVHFSAQLKTSA